MKLSVVIPAQNEAESIGSTLEAVVAELEREGIEHEVVVVDDGSIDGTGEVVRAFADRSPSVRCVRSDKPPGFGHAVRVGLERYTGDAVAILMADLSDSPADLVRYYRVLEAGYDCVFGTRFGHGGSAHDYPIIKLVINRVVNTGIRALFRHDYNDTTNAFKAYRRHVIDQLDPLLSNHFNLTVELPLKAITRGFSYAVVPITWSNRPHGQSKLNLNEMGSRYLFIVLYVWLEHHLSRGDYRRKDVKVVPAHRPSPALTGRAGLFESPPLPDGERAEQRSGERFRSPGESPTHQHAK
jgi:dolichol-phosphate mannosyltransferase